MASKSESSIEEDKKVKDDKNVSGSESDSSLKKTIGRRRSIFRSLSSDHIGTFEGRFKIDDDFTSEEKNSIIHNEKLIRQLEVISQRFDGYDGDRGSAGSSQSSGDSSMDHSSIFKTTDDIYDYSSSRETSEEQEIGDDIAEELLILPPDHPLMQRFQNLYQTHLEKMKEKQTLELNALKVWVKEAMKTYENDGEELYNAQKELSNSQAQLELCHKDWHEFLDERKTMQVQLVSSRSQHEESEMSARELEKKVLNYRGEINKWDLLINLMSQLREEMRGDVGALRRAAEKVDDRLIKLQDEKHQQDVAIKTKMEEAIRMEETIEMYKKHRVSQEDELTKARLNLAESQMRIECIEVEKRHVFQQWKHTLSQLEQKDDAIKTLYESLTGLLNESFTRSANINNLKKAVDKEMELNETLIMAKTRTQRLSFHTESEIKKCVTKSEKLKSELALKFRILEETENSLRDTNKSLQEIKRLDDINRKQLDLIVSKRCDLEDQLAEKYLDFISSEKAITRSEKEKSKLGKTVQHMEGEVVKVENDLAHLVLDHTSANIRCQKLNEDLHQHNQDVQEHTDFVRGLETLISKNNATITNKQALMNSLIGRLDQFIQDAGGDVSPLETRIKNLEKNIELKTNEMQMLKVNWLNRQTELVFLTHERDHLTATCIKLGRQFNIFSEKKRRLENNIEELKKDIHRIEMSFKSLQNTITKLSENIYHERGHEVDLTTERNLTENAIILTLKDAELESIQFQEKLNAMKNEKSELEVQLVEARQQILLWEKKTELAKESKALVASEEISGEMQAMKWDIHRMQNRYTQLKRHQEILVQETEKFISRRDTIFSKNETQMKSGKKPMTKSTIQKTIEDLKNKIKHTVKERQVYEEEVAQLLEKKEVLNNQKEKLTKSVSSLENQVEGLEKSVEQTERHYQKNFQHLIALQQRTKFLQSTKEKKYIMLCKNDSQVKNEVSRSWAVAQTLQEIVNKLCQKFPMYKDGLLDLASRHEGRLASLEPVGL